MAARPCECEAAAAPRRRQRRRFWQFTDQVLLIGYHPEIRGGVTTVMSLLCSQMPELVLHPALRYYRPWWKAQLYWLVSLWAFTLKLVTGPPRIVQVIIGSPGDTMRTLPFVLLARVRGCRVCLHFHKNRAGLLGTLPRGYRKLVLQVWRIATAYVFLSRRLRDEFVGELNPNAHRLVIANPIAEAWLGSKNVPRERRSGQLVFLGRWTHEKGVDDLIAAMQRVNSAQPVTCDVFSDHVAAQGPPHCALHPWLDEEQVRRVLSEAKLLVLPSHAEAFPTVLLEAAACGTPFVASDVAGIPDIVEASGGGLMHHVGDVDGLSRAVLRLLSDDGLWRQCSENGRRWVASLAVDLIVPQWRRCYAELGIKQV